MWAAGLQRQAGAGGGRRRAGPARWPRRSSPTASSATASSASWTTRRSARHAACPSSARFDDASQVIAEHGVDQLYVALPLEEHAKLLRPHQERQQRVRGHQGRARPRAVRDHQGRPRGPRRHPDHQPQRGAAAGLEQHGQAGHGRRARLRCCCSLLSVPLFAVIAVLIKLEGRAGPGASSARSG